VTGDLDCAGGTSWEAGWGCVAGYFVPALPAGAAAVAWPGVYGGAFYPTAYAHELCHARSWMLTGDEDHDHDPRGVCFSHPAGLVDLADGALWSAGL